MGKGSSGGTNTVTQNSQPPAWLQTELQNLGTAAQGVATSPLNQYSGPLVAGFTPDQTQAMSTVDNSQGLAQNYYNTASNYLSQATQPLASGSQGYVDAASGQFSAAGQTGANLPGAVNPYTNQATNLFNAGANGLNANSINSYMSPYINDVVNSTQAQFNNANQQQQQGVIGNAITQGAWGGDRSAVAQGIVAGQQQLAQAPVIAGLYNSGYGQAEQTAAQNAGLQMQAGQGLLGAGNQTLAANQAGAQLQLAAGQGQAGLGQQVLGANEAQGWLNSQAASQTAGLGTSAQNAALTGASAQYGMGTAQQQQAQQQLNVPYEQFLQQQAYPYQQLNWLSGVINGTAGSAGGTSSTTSPGASTLSQVGGGLLGATGIIGGTGGFGSSGWLTGLLAAKRGGRMMPQRRASGGVAPVTVGQGVMPPDVSVSYVPDPTTATPGAHGAPKPPAAMAQEDPMAQGMGILKNVGKDSFKGLFSGSSQPALNTDSSMAMGTVTPPADVTIETLRRGGVIPFRKRAAGGAGMSAADAKGLVTGDYSSILGRAPDAAGLQGWTNALTSGTATPDQVRLGMLGSQENFNKVTPQINNAYQVALGRAPDAAGLQGWLGSIGSGQNTANQVVSGIANSPEAQAQHPYVSYGQGSNGVLSPYVSQNMFHTPSANVAAMSGGPAGMGTAFNPLPQYQPPGTTTTTTPGVGKPGDANYAAPTTAVAYPHTTTPSNKGITDVYNPAPPVTDPLAAATGNSDATYVNGAKRGGVIPFPAHRIRKRDDGGSLDPVEPVEQIPYHYTDADAAALSQEMDARQPAPTQAGVVPAAPPPQAPVSQGVAPAAAVSQGVVPQQPTLATRDGRLAALQAAASTDPYKPLDTKAAKEAISNPHVDPWMALAAAGFGMMSGTSPFAGVNIGKGAMAGLQEYASEKKAAQQAAKEGFDADAKAKEMADRAEQWRASYGKDLATSAESMAHNQAAEEQSKAQLDATSKYQMGSLDVQRLNAQTQAAGTLVSTGKTTPEGNVIYYNNRTGKEQVGANASGDAADASNIMGTELAAKTQGLKGPDLLAALPPDMQPTIQSWIEGRSPMPTGRSLADPDVRRMVTIANMVDPTLDQGTWKARSELRTSFGKGADGQAIGAIDQAVLHLAAFDKNAKKLNNSAVPAENTAINNALEQLGDPRPANLRRSQQAIATELAKAWRGNGSMSEQEVNDWKQTYGVNSSKETLDQAPAETIALLDGAMDKIEHKWLSTMGPTAKMYPILSPAAQEAYDRLSQGQGRYASPEAKARFMAGEGSAPQPAAPAAQLPAAEHRVPGQTMTPNGKFIWSESGWVPRQGGQ